MILVGPVVLSIPGESGVWCSRYFTTRSSQGFPTFGLNWKKRDEIIVTKVDQQWLLLGNPNSSGHKENVIFVSACTVKYSRCEDVHIFGKM